MITVTIDGVCVDCYYTEHCGCLDITRAMVGSADITEWVDRLCLIDRVYEQMSLDMVASAYSNDSLMEIL